MWLWLVNSCVLESVYNSAVFREVGMCNSIVFVLLSELEQAVHGGGRMWFPGTTYRWEAIGQGLPCQRIRYQADVWEWPSPLLRGGYLQQGGVYSGFDLVPRPTQAFTLQLTNFYVRSLNETPGEASVANVGLFKASHASINRRKLM